jgi:hypothetical protein
VSCTGDNVVRPREQKLAICRNMALSVVREDYYWTQYIIFVDLDVVGWNINGIIDSFAMEPFTNWDVVCARGVGTIGIYRDVYAFRDASQDINTNHHLHSLDSTPSTPTMLRPVSEAFANFTVTLQ